VKPIFYHPATLTRRVRRYPTIASKYWREIKSASSVASPLSNRRAGVRGQLCRRRHDDDVLRADATDHCGAQLLIPPSEKESLCANWTSARAPFEPTCVQVTKALITGQDEDAIKDEIAAQLREETEARPDALFLLGPGSTVQAVGHALHVRKTLLGIDPLSAVKSWGRICPSVRSLSSLAVITIANSYSQLSYELLRGQAVPA
jgi:hypothetical protein